MIEVKFVKAHEKAKLPVYGSEEAAGADVHSVAEYIVKPGHNTLVDTGLDCVIPKGWEIQVRPRSGIALKKKITVLNTPGTIDSDYGGRLGVNIINLGEEDFVISIGDRIAQLVLAPVYKAEFSWANEVRDTKRGADGFGSTGT